MNTDELKIIYVSHRYHTNQVPIMEGWFKLGTKVRFLAIYEGVSEVHDFVEFHKIKSSILSKICNIYFSWRYDPSIAEGKKSGAFIPCIFDLIWQFVIFRPHIVILREYTKTNAIISILCKILYIKKVIMYQQTPLYGHVTKKRMIDIIAKHIYPKVVFTPVLYKGKKRTKNIMSKGWSVPRFFVPLVHSTCNNAQIINSSSYIRLLDVGKYRDYKNHFFLVDAIDALTDKSSIHLTIIGQLSQNAEFEYYERLQNYINSKKLQAVITLRGNVPYKEMDSIYSQSDVLILPSLNESAGMVILEAMARGLYVMASEECGLASYLDEYDCGFVFPLDSSKILSLQLELICKNKNILIENGNKAKEIVKNHFTFNNYFNAINNLLKVSYGFEIFK